MNEIAMPAVRKTEIETAGPGSCSYAAGSRPAVPIVLFHGGTEHAGEVADMSLATNVYPGGVMPKEAR
jgi:hypothetical protein